MMASTCSVVRITRRTLWSAFADILMDSTMTKDCGRSLYFGDNLERMRKLDQQTVDLVYLDPPFNSQANYNLLFKEKTGEKSAEQIAAFGDTWTWGPAARLALDETIEMGPPRVAELLRAFADFLKDTDMLAYIAMMAPRLLELQRVLKDTGSIYLHCDPTASHYLKLMMDAVFGPLNFRNEIIWRRTGSHNSARRYGPIHDTILFYSKTKNYYWKKNYR